MIKASVFVKLKPSVLDPQGKAITSKLTELGYDSVMDVRVGKVIEIQFDESDKASVSEQVEKMCATMLANPNIEDYSYNIEIVE